MLISSNKKMTHGFILKNEEELEREREDRNLFQSIFMTKVPYEQPSFKHSTADEYLSNEDLEAGYVAFWSKASSLLVVITLTGICMKYALQLTHTSQVSGKPLTS